jgi:hypothetical protein
MHTREWYRNNDNVGTTPRRITVPNVTQMRNRNEQRTHNEAGT